MSFPIQLIASRLLCILAHPDDELYCCNYLREILRQGGEVSVAYIMDEDIGRDESVRKKEALASMQEIGVDSNNVFFIGMGKREAFDQLDGIVQKLREITKAAQLDCILAQDFEGGHEAHDIASFCASEVVRLEDIPKHIVFPVYHGKPQERKGARFVNGRESIIEFPLDYEGGELKKRILDFHVSQRAHFDGLKRSSIDYEELLLTREVFIIQVTPIDYYKKPADIIGYEFHRNGFSFADFQDALVKYKIRASA